ncbi:hypothetical protein LCGC14_2441450 [marine sediment metagenome]|uniref:ASCH domain-containing protein n=1 Tax=marine sediment metagenome TaxID=412755 RepID=A0A0F9C6B9_9ZZZZ
MVRAILDGRKTQTRRVIKPQPDTEWLEHIIKRNKTNRPYGEFGIMVMVDGKEKKSPYGVPGDKLYVRERFAFHKHYDHLAPSKVPDFAEVQYFATDEETMLRGKWRPSIHMPKWASRITLEIKDMRVERVRDITEEDAKSEGVSEAEQCDHVRQACEDIGCYGNGHRATFAHLWDSINLKRGYPWSKNCWVWVVEFEVINGRK